MYNHIELPKHLKLNAASTCKLFQCANLLAVQTLWMHKPSLPIEPFKVKVVSKCKHYQPYEVANRLNLQTIATWKPSHVQKAFTLQTLSFCKPVYKCTIASEFCFQIRKHEARDPPRRPHHQRRGGGVSVLTRKIRVVIQWLPVTKVSFFLFLGSVQSATKSVHVLGSLRTHPFDHM